MDAPSISTETLLELHDASAGYGAATVLKSVSLRIAAGEVVGLLGRNGMGKTTLIRTITGQLPLRGGALAVCGRDVAGWPTHRIARLGVGLVPEGRQVFPNLSVHEHLSAFARPSTSPAVTSAEVWTPEAIYALFPRLDERRENLGHQLSGGEQQMLAIGRALATHPRLLILDEVTEGLAPLVREEIWRALARLRTQGQAILVVDKYVQRLIDLADRHVILEKGAQAWAGTSAELETDRSLWSRYLGV